MNSVKRVLLEEVVEALRQLPKPKAAWKAIERELLQDTPASRALGSVTLLAGAILQGIPEDQRNEWLEQVKTAAEVAWEFYLQEYGSADVFNNYRLDLRESINGWLSAPVGRPVSPESLVKKNKAWSMSQDCWDWLEAQPNQSETLRRSIEAAMPEAATEGEE